MQTAHLIPYVAAAIGLVTFANAGCAAKDEASGVPPAPVSETNSAPPVTPILPPAPRVVPPAPAASPAVASAEWADIKDCTYEKRAQFFSGLKRLEARADAEMAELTAKRAIMDGTTDTKDWDFAMKEMTNTRFYFRAMGEEIHQATSESWDEQLAKVGEAWGRTQEAFAHVKASTTS